MTDLPVLTYDSYENSTEEQFMNLNELFALQFMMFAEMAAGYTLCRIHILKPSDRKIFSESVIRLFLPCSIISSFNIGMDSDTLRDFLLTLAVSSAIMLFCAFLARVLYNRESSEKKAIMQYATVCSNAGFLGNAVAEGVYGDMGLLYGQIYLIPVRIVLWTAGVSYFEKNTDSGSKLKKILTHPCIVAMFIGLLRMILQIPLYAGIDKTLVSLGRCSTPLIMLSLGMILAETGFGNMFRKDIIRFSFIRLIMIPAAVFAACRICHLDSFITGLAVLLTAMPAGSTTSVLAETYHSDVEFAAKIVIATTILSVLLLPAWVMIVR